MRRLPVESYQLYGYRSRADQNFYIRCSCLYDWFIWL